MTEKYKEMKTALSITEYDVSVDGVSKEMKHDLVRKKQNKLNNSYKKLTS